MRSIDVFKLASMLITKPCPSDGYNLASIKQFPMENGQIQAFTSLLNTLKASGVGRQNKSLMKLSQSFLTNPEGLVLPSAFTVFMPHMCYRCSVHLAVHCQLLLDGPGWSITMAVPRICCYKVGLFLIFTSNSKWIICNLGTENLSE